MLKGVIPSEINSRNGPIKLAYYVTLRSKYKYSTLPRGISIIIALKVGICPGLRAEVNIHYQGCNIIDIPQGRVEYLFHYIG